MKLKSKGCEQVTVLLAVIIIYVFQIHYSIDSFFFLIDYSVTKPSKSTIMHLFGS